MHISESQRRENKSLHARDENYGTGGADWAAYLEQTMADESLETVLDYGCGKGTLAKALKRRGITVGEYDPAIPAKDALPDPAHLVVCTDVLEHVEPDEIDGLLAHLAQLTQKKLFFDIATAPALKTLADGRNAHLIVEGPDWWRHKLTRHFDIVHWVERLECNFIYGEAVPKGSPLPKPNGHARRKMSPEISRVITLIRESGRNADALHRINSIRLYEGLADEPADLQIAFDVMDEAEDAAKMFADIVRLSRKAVIIRARLTEERNEAFWKKLVEERLHVFEWQVGKESIVCVGAPRVGTRGLMAIGVVDTDTRWQYVRRASEKISKRIPLSEAHERRAIVACYGPSLKDTIERLRQERIESGGAVISVSGAHDFLLENGIVPDYHVECDPRAHKADNIVKGHPDVEYLLGSGCHPVLFDKLEGLDIALWHIATPEHIKRFASELRENGQYVICGGGSVGLRSIPLLYTMGYRDFSIYGMDCSFADEGKEQWAGRHAGKIKDVCQIVLANGLVFATSPVLITYATDFIEMVQKVAITLRLYGDGLLQAMCAMHAELAAAQTNERELNGHL